MNISVIKGQTVNFQGNGQKLQETDTYGNLGFKSQIKIILHVEITIHEFADICVWLKIILPGCVAAYKKNKKEGK